MQREKRGKRSRAHVRHVQWRRLSLEASLFPAFRGELTVGATLLTRLWLPQIELAVLASTELCSRQSPIAYLARERLRGCLSGSLLVQNLVIYMLGVAVFYVSSFLPYFKSSLSTIPKQKIILSVILLIPSKTQNHWARRHTSSKATKGVST